MVKLVTMFKLKPDFDPEESYKLWSEIHTAYIKKIFAPELKKYVIGRVVRQATPGQEGEDFFGVVQCTFENADDAQNAVKKVLNAPDEFQNRIGESHRVVIEEKEIEL